MTETAQKGFTWVSLIKSPYLQKGIQTSQRCDTLWKKYILLQAHNVPEDVPNIIAKYKVEFAKLDSKLSPSTVQKMYNFIEQVYYPPTMVRDIFEVVSGGVLK